MFFIRGNSYNIHTRQWHKQAIAACGAAMAGIHKLPMAVVEKSDTI
jgi:hypothetical protein